MSYCTYTRIIILLPVLWLVLVAISTVRSQECDTTTRKAEDGTTTCSNSNLATSSSCHYDTNICTIPSTIYGSMNSGTAIAYVPNQPITSIVCDASDTTDSSNKHMLKSLPYRVAKWPFSRSSTKRKVDVSFATVAPTLQIQINILSCQTSHTSSSSSATTAAASTSTSFSSFFFSSNTKKDSKSSSSQKQKQQQEVTTCCCQPYTMNEDIEIEMWQTRPDGTYPSLISATKHDNNECRARQILTAVKVGDNNNATSSSSSSSVTFRTLAPGSSGAFNGLGPNGYDIPPYGPPVIHIMVHSSKTLATTTFIDVPIIPLSSSTKPGGLGRGKFYGSDYRGTAWVQSRLTTKSNHNNNQQQQQQQYEIKSWQAIPNKNHINIEIDLLIPQQPNQNTGSSTTTPTTKSSKTNNNKKNKELLLCPSSYWYGLLPHSFFLEPIAVCAPSLLNFFHL